MNNLLKRILPKNDEKRKWLAMGLTVFISWLLTLFGIYGLQEYGYAMFILTPFFIGMAPAILYGFDKEINMKASIEIGMLTLCVFIASLLVFGFEGLICIIMAAPPALLLTLIGSVSGYAILKKIPKRASAIIVLLMGSIPLTAFVERNQEHDLNSVVTSIEINASPETVWQNVVEFPQLDEPTEFIFKAGIAYPINAKIDGTGVGAIRHCNFTTGSFVEPITVWNEPELLRFDVTVQPAPMKEISFRDIEAPHLRDYFKSRRGQFKLTRLPNGNTLLEGTTWYYHDIRPAFYWEIWSEYIIHKIHERVLLHIKKTAEAEKAMQ